MTNYKRGRSIWKDKIDKYGSDRGGFPYDAPPPRLTTAAQERKAEKQRSELNGTAEQRERSKVTLPKLNWLSRDKKDDR